MTKLSEIEYAIQEAKNLNMGNTVPVMTIITQAAKMARTSVDEVYSVYYDKVNKEFSNVESATW
jgi:hypothetical protein